ncbi:B-type cyclin [Cryptotrichosporon argae]
MASRAAAPRRVAARRANDENAAPTAGVTRKSALAHLGPAQKVAPSTAPAKPASKSAVPVKAGIKRNVLGTVTNIKEEEGTVHKADKAVKQEPRQPLAPRTAPQQTRPIAPVPHRAKPTAVYSELPLSIDEGSEMDLDPRHVARGVAPAAEFDVEVDDMGLEELSGGEDEDEDDEEDDEDADDWMRITEDDALVAAEQLARVRDSFDDDVDLFDTTMAAEYAEDIFRHMEELEQTVMPNPRYMEFQTEIEWTMRTTLIDWLLQVHLRYHMLPETLWIAVNLVDRFLSQRVVSLVKLQLVGVTAMFIAAKYEEILAPSVDEFVFMTENGYTKEEILKGERIILQTLNFTVSSYCSPYSWVRRISKADDYDIQTRTLSKFLMEVTLMDHRFLRCKPSMVAAIGMYVARRMLGGDWNDAFVFYSNYTEIQLVPAAQLLCARLLEQDFETCYVYKKYANKKFLRASAFAREWAQASAATAFERE